MKGKRYMQNKNCQRCPSKKYCKIAMRIVDRKQKRKIFLFLLKKKIKMDIKRKNRVSISKKRISLFL